MTTGVRLPVADWAGRAGDELRDFERRDPHLARAGVDGIAAGAGASTNTQPLELNTNPPRPGAVAGAFFEDYYNQVYFLPGNVDFGAVAGDTERSVSVWNANLTTTTLTGLTMTNVEGLAISAGPQPPHDFGPLAFDSYTFVTGTEGPPSIEGVITFTFDTPEVFDLELFGTRAKISPLVPNWRDTYVTEYRFSTEIFRSRSGKEQRRALRRYPRRQISYRATPAFDQLREANRLFASWQNNTIVLPEIPKQVRTSTPLAAGERIVNLEGPLPRWLFEDQTVVLGYYGEYATLRVQSAAEGQVVFTGASGRDWPAGTILHPALSGRFTENIRSRRLTSAVANVPVEVMVTPGSAIPVPLTEAPITYAGREVFTHRPNWANEPEVEYQAEREVIDYDRGRTAIFTPIDYPTRLTSLTFLSRDYAEADRLIEFFLRATGRRGEFYLPSGEPDVIMKSTAPATTATLRTAGHDFANDYAGTTVYRAVEIRLKDGRSIYRRVTAIFKVEDTDGDDSVLQLNEPFTEDIRPDDVVMISWMPLSRFASDTMTVEWITTTIAQCKLTFQSLEDVE